MAAVDVVIPTLNAGAALGACLDALDAGPVVREVIVSDGGSTDGTVDMARARGCRVVREASGRGPQVRAGVAAVRAPWLLILHADTALASGWDRAVAEHIAAHGPGVAAAFRLAYAPDSRPARRVARWANRRAGWLGLPYGDQGLLISRELYERVGGVPDVPLMEDVALVRAVGRRRLRLLPARAVTSPARYVRGGWWARPTRNLGILALYLAGVPPRRLARLYA